MTTDTSVKYFDSSMSGAPALSNTAGTLISVLDACLVNGFGSMTLTSLVIAGNVATATKTGHGFVMRGSTGPVIAISGATPAELNTEFRIQSIIDANTFTFTTSGIADQTATGTISAKRAPAGFSKAFSGTNKGAYQSNDPAGTQLFLRADDTTTTYARTSGYEAMTDVDSGSGEFPPSSTLGFHKSDTGSQPWVLIADTRAFYPFCRRSDGEWWSHFFFGDIVSFVGADAFACALIAPVYNGAYYLSPQLPVFNVTTNSVLARSYTQTGGAVGALRLGGALQTLSANGYSTLYPAFSTQELLLVPVSIWETLALPRGLMPGFYSPLCNQMNHGQIIENIPSLPGRTLITQDLDVTTAGHNVKGLFDISGPWR